MSVGVGRDSCGVGVSALVPAVLDIRCCCCCAVVVVVVVAVTLLLAGERLGVLRSIRTLAVSIPIPSIHMRRGAAGGAGTKRRETRKDRRTFS